MDDYPKLRNGLEASAVEHEDQRMILISDRIGLSEMPLIMSPLAASLLEMMDGEHSLRDLQAHCMRVTGQMVFLEDLQDVVRRLDESLFLDNERFRDVLVQRMAQFHDDPVRRMKFAGSGYPAEATALKARLDSFFPREAGGPGLPFQALPQRRLLGLVVPHIDINAGGPCFAHAYKALSESFAPDTWVILGTGHEPIEHHFALTVKDFETPLGPVRCDRELAEELERRVPRGIRTSEYNHAREHSVEFQAVFLAHLQPKARIIPLLCSFSLEDAENDRDYIDEVARIMGDLAGSGDRSVGFMASVDLAHIGPRYGDRFHPTRIDVQENLEADARLLDLLARGDSDGFMRTLLREHNRRRICGMGPLYVLSRILSGKAQGELLHHTEAAVDRAGSFVTFASMAFYAL
jgi:AmmeMemoRadiSam system protein B